MDNKIFMPPPPKNMNSMPPRPPMPPRPNMPMPPKPPVQTQKNNVAQVVEQSVKTENGIAEEKIAVNKELHDGKVERKKKEAKMSVETVGENDEIQPENVVVEDVAEQPDEQLSKTGKRGGKLFYWGGFFLCLVVMIVIVYLLFTM